MRFDRVIFRLCLPRLSFRCKNEESCVIIPPSSVSTHLLRYHANGQDAIDEVIEIMDDYFLTKEDWDALVELGVGSGYDEEAVLKLIPSATKSAFTRKCVFLPFPPFYLFSDSNRVG